MVENYPTALRSLVLAENSISPELQQQICDLLSEGEEEEEVAGGPGGTRLLTLPYTHQVPAHPFPSPRLELSPYHTKATSTTTPSVK